MTKPKKNQYRIQYVDNTFQMVDWTKKEFETVGQQMCEDKEAITLDDGIFRLSSIRAIVFIPPVPELTDEEKKAQAEQQLTEWGFVDNDTAVWLKNAGIDLGGVNQ